MPSQSIIQWRVQFPGQRLTKATLELESRVADPRHLDADPDLAFHFDADPDLTTHFSKIWTLSNQRCGTGTGTVTF
jgi:hypothetical protein